jgi:hypothetical protein
MSCELDDSVDPMVLRVVVVYSDMDGHFERNLQVNHGKRPFEFWSSCLKSSIETTLILRICRCTQVPLVANESICMFYQVTTQTELAIVI